MRLVECDELYAEFRRDIMGGLNWDRILREAKTVDAVPVVRCKDCKWWHDWNGECYGNGNMGYGVGRKADDFCSWGERKDG